MSALATVTPFPNTANPQQGRDSAPQFVTSAEESAHRMQDLRDFVRKQLKEGVDFGCVPGTPKPTLFRPGAEKLLSAYGFSTHNETLHRIEDFDKGFLSYEVKVVIKNKRSGVIEAEGIGSCNSKERKYKSQDAANLANTILRMAKKRALIDATLLATRSSELFQTGDHSEASDESTSQSPNRSQPQRNQSNQQRPQQQQGQNRPAPGQSSQQRNVAPPQPVPASRETVANTERLRRLAVAEGFTANNDAHLKPILHSLTQGQCEARLNQLREWLKTKAPESLKDLNGSGKFMPSRDARFVKCRSCNWAITFVQTKEGGNMPVDADGVPHFLMCTRPEAHRKKDVERQPTPRQNAPAPTAGELTKHVKHLWAVVGAAALPPSKQGKYRTERIDAANQVLLDHQIDAVESFNDLTPEGSQVLCGAIDAKLIVASPEGFWEVAS